MRSLLWKEWHEQRWKLAFGSLILAAFALIGLHARVVADHVLLEWVCVLATLLLPVLASTGLLPAERSDGTLPTLLALPVNPLRIFLVKSLVGILLCGAPLIVAGAVSVAAAGGREVSVVGMIDLHVRALAVTLSLFFWMFALTVRLPSETRAAMIAVGILIAWLIVTAGLVEAWRMNQAPSWFWALTPFVFIVGFRWVSWVVPLPVSFAIHIFISLALWFWAARQLTSEAEGRS